MQKKSKESESVKVCIRCRPLSSNEMNQGHTVVVECKISGEIFVKRPYADEPPKQFTFDSAFDWNSSQQAIYEDTSSSIISNVLEGYNGTIFAYGQTGTGKTHTMTGIEDDHKQRGIIPRAFEDVFKGVQSDSVKTQFLIRASYLEIYNEECRDLLSKNPKKKLELHEKPDSGVYVKDLSYFAVKDVSEIREVMHIGQKNRSVRETMMNAASSRSHSLFTITVERSEVGADGQPHIRVGKLNMVDLAGSERLSKTGAVGDGAKEAAKINLSLSTLCHVISALTDPKATYIPYRESKLTRLLQDSLGGNTKTVMIANVGPADYNYDETLNTLRYASRAKNIQNKPRINEDPKDALLREYQDEVSKLRQQLAAIQSGADPSELMKKHGIIGKQVIEVEKKIFVEDKEKMREFEEKLQQEKDDIRRKTEEEKQRIMQEKSMREEEKQKLLEELQKREQEQEKAKTKQQKLIQKLKKMEEKMIAGSQVMEVAKKQQKELMKTKKELEKERQQEEDLQKRLQEKEKGRMQIIKKFNNLQEELEFTNNKMESLWREYQELCHEHNSIRDDFDRERNDMYDTIYELSNQLKLKNLIIDNFIPPEDFKKIEKITEWAEDINDWVIRKPDFKDTKQGSKRPQSAVGMKRPTSEYSRIAKGLGDLNPRYKFDNILQLDLDMPERTTEDYEGMPSSKVQQAIQAILNDDDTAPDNIPISTLINFNDSCLVEEIEKKKATRLKSAKSRPKSAKKKPE
eukprot:403342083